MTFDVTMCLLVGTDPVRDTGGRIWSVGEVTGPSAKSAMGCPAIDPPVSVVTCRRRGCSTDLCISGIRTGDLSAASTDIFLLSKVRSESGAYPAPYTVGTGAVPPGESSGGVKLATDRHLVLRLMVEVYLHSPIRLVGIVLN
jgi:hypothetical protein